MDFAAAGDAAAGIKRALAQIGMDSDVVRRCAIAAYEAEMNVVIHAYEGTITADITPDGVEVIIDDVGPGIPDVELAMQEGYTTAPPHIQEMGFGAGMGLPNIRKCADEFDLQSQVGKGTRLRILIRKREAGPADG
jgi:anti-sigma regulatory factor (Ser/Thr protein kinase)